MPDSSSFTRDRQASTFTVNEDIYLLADINGKRRRLESIDDVQDADIDALRVIARQVPFSNDIWVDADERKRESLG